MDAAALIRVVFFCHANYVLKERPLFVCKGHGERTCNHPCHHQMCDSGRWKKQLNWIVEVLARLWTWNTAHLHVHHSRNAAVPGPSGNWSQSRKVFDCDIACTYVHDGDPGDMICSGVSWCNPRSGSKISNVWKTTRFVQYLAKMQLTDWSV